MPSTLLSPFPEVDTDLSKDFVSLLAGANLSPGREQSSTQSSSCPVNLNEDTKDKENVTDSTVWPQQSPWSRDSELAASSALRHIPFQADRSVSMIEESKVSPTKPAATSRYKTELCRPFQESGFCKYGSKCQFAHGSCELRGLNRHPKYKTELCRTYHTIGFCPYGSRCHFIHNAEEQRFNSSSKGQRPPPLRHSVSCSGIPSSSSSSSSSSSLSIFSGSLGSSLSSLSPFCPESPLTPTSNSFASVGSISPISPPASSGQPVFRSVSPSSSAEENPLVVNLPMPLSPWEPKEEPKVEDKWDSLPKDEDTEESASVCDNSPESKRLPIFSFLSD